MDKADQYNRCTGHTSRMLREAIILVLCYKTVAVITHTEHLAKDFRKQTERIARRLGVEEMDAWDWKRVGFFGVNQFAKLKDGMEKNGVIVMGDPGLADILSERSAMLGLPLPPDWPT